MNVLIKGEVKKWINFIKGWSKRYFILREDVLEYYDNIKRTGKSKKIHLNVIDFKDTERDL